jgi:curved DNA-binding protein CbpA
MHDPFTVLGIDEHADDEEIKRRYLALVRAYPPDREPELFQAYRAAYEALADQRKRLEAKLLHTHDAALLRVKLLLLGSVQPLSSRASKATISGLLAEGISRACSQQNSAPET